MKLQVPINFISKLREKLPLSSQLISGHCPPPPGKCCPQTATFLPFPLRAKIIIPHRQQIFEKFVSPSRKWGGHYVEYT